MTVATAEMATKRPANPWMASLYGGIFTAVIAAAYFLLLQTNMPILWGLALILIGAGPVRTTCCALVGGCRGRCT